MTTTQMARGPVLQLPWSASKDDDQKFRKITLIALFLFVVFSVIVPLLPVQEVEREELEEIPPQLAKIELEKKELPPPPEVEKKEEPVEKKVEPPKPKPKPKVKPKPKPKQTVEQARDKAALSGLLQFKDDLQEMRDSVDKDKLSNNQLSRASGEAKKIERSIITGKTGSTSGGINTSRLSRNTGGAALSGRETTKVTGPVANLGKGDGSGTGGSSSGRSDESVRKVFDRNKGSIFSIYNRALRKDPALQGKVTIKLVIEPSGAVSSVKLVSSELNNPALESKLIARIKLVSFGAEDVSRTTVNYSFDFLPF